MQSFLTERGSLESDRQAVLHELRRRIWASTPSQFRGDLIIGEDGLRLSTALESWQRSDFDALEPAWRFLAGLRAPAALWRAWIERPRGHSKTTDLAVQLLWILGFSGRRVEGLVAAADRDQAALIVRAVERLQQLNPGVCPDIERRQFALVNVRTGSRLDVVTADVDSSWGVTPDFVICDELCHWAQPELWYSLLSSAAKKPECLLVVLTNAGVGRGWHWDAREAARSSPWWHFSSLDGPQAPWITQVRLDEQRSLLPAAVYDLLCAYRWQDSGGEFVTLAEAEACVDPDPCLVDRGQRGVQYFAAVDYAEKHDYTVGIVLHRAPGGFLVVDRCDVVRPVDGRPTPVQWVETWCESTARLFGSVVFVLDEYQLLGTIQKLSGTLDIRRFAFLSGAGNHALALNLRRLICSRGLRWYPGCGSIDVPWGRDDLCTELASCLLEQAPSGRCRINHIRDLVHHDDRAFALGVAALEATRSACTSDFFSISQGDWR